MIDSGAENSTEIWLSPSDQFTSVAAASDLAERLMREAVRTRPKAHGGLRQARDRMNPANASTISDRRPPRRTSPRRTSSAPSDDRAS